MEDLVLEDVYHSSRAENRQRVVATHTRIIMHLCLIAKDWVSKRNIRAPLCCARPNDNVGRKVGRKVGRRVKR